MQRGGLTPPRLSKPFASTLMPQSEASSASSSVTGLPRPLSDDDVLTYRAARDSQDRRAWAVADQEISRLSDRVLVGRLLAQRYLSPDYQPRLDELKSWMALYADYPQAEDIYDLARKRFNTVTGVRAPVRGEPTSGALTSREELASWGDFSLDDHRGGAAEKRKLVALKQSFRSLVRNESFSAARAQLASDSLAKLAGPGDIDELKAVLARGLFYVSRDEDALLLAEEAADRSGARLPEAHWIAGLALWRLGRGDEAAEHFEAVARSGAANSWLSTAGAFWAARAHLVARHPEQVNRWLTRAATRPRNFYGLLARRALGEEIQYSAAAEERSLTPDDIAQLNRLPGSDRVMALLQIGDPAGAEEELRHLALIATPAQSQAMLALATAADLSGAALRLGGLVAAQASNTRNSAAYPVPQVKPAHGWIIDKALILAIVRQESDFKAHSRSRSGAVGLMQVMPASMRQVRMSGKLTDPEINLDIGQRYLRYLMEDGAIGGNLIYLLAAFNAGPGSFSRWSPGIPHHNDPLLFIESIPIRETHDYVERVLSNFWAYRNRLGQDSPSLDALVSGSWPMYDGPDNKQAALQNDKA